MCRMDCKAFMSLKKACRLYFEILPLKRACRMSRKVFRELGSRVGCVVSIVLERVIWQRPDA